MIKLNKDDILEIIVFIDEQLRLRCINVDTTLETDGKKFKLISTKFNTVPVLHSAITINDFGSHINEVKENVLVDPEKGTIKRLTRLRFHIEVHANYEGNGVELFTVWGIKNKGSHELFLQTNRID